MPCKTRPAPLDMTSAFGFGQPSRGATSRKDSSPKFHIARADAPMFSPICGFVRMKTGCGPCQFWVSEWFVPDMIIMNCELLMVNGELFFVLGM